MSNIIAIGNPFTVVILSKWTNPLPNKVYGKLITSMNNNKYWYHKGKGKKLEVKYSSRILKGQYQCFVLDCKFA